MARVIVSRSRDGSVLHRSGVIRSYPFTIEMVVSTLIQALFLVYC
jgi:hypothetical protein